MTTVGEFAQLITAVALAYNIWQTHRNGQKSNKIAADVEVIHLATNSLTDKLVTSTAKASLAEGTAAGLEQGRNEERK